MLFNDDINVVFNNLEDEIKAFSDEIDLKFQEIDNNVQDNDERNKKKKILLNQLNEISDMLIKENKESQENNMTKTIFNTIKYCLFGTITYIFTKDVAVNIILEIFKINPIISLILFVFSITIGALIFIIPQHIVNRDYFKKMRVASIKKIVIDSKLKELN